MKVHVQSVDGCRVGVVTPIGTATGTWVGASPAIDHDCDVELEVPGVLAWENIKDAGQTGSPNLAERPDGLVWMRGRVDDIDEDLVLRLWLGETSVLIDSVGDPPLGVVGRFVDIVVEDLAIFPVDY
jgi:hypothetical protein